VNLGYFFPQEKFFVEVEIIFFISKFGRISPQRKTPVPIAGNTKVLPAFLCPSYTRLVMVCPMGLFGQMGKALGSTNCSKVGFLFGMSNFILVKY
jgi:hypothetical protein